MSRAPTPIPDLDDEEIKRRLEPLKASVLPGTRPPTPTKPPRKSLELLLPEAVVAEIKRQAAVRGISASVLMLELLRGAGFPVTEADFTDLRKAPRR